jgi:hypothetical protein
MSMLLPKMYNLPDGKDMQYYLDNLPTDWEDAKKYGITNIPMPKEVEARVKLLQEKYDGHWPIEDARKAIEKAGYVLLMDIGAYYGNLLHNLKLTITESIPTAGVCIDSTDNVVRLAVNPNFFMILRDTDRVGILYHELQHIVYLHIYQKGVADHKKRNYAADLAINAPLLKVRPTLMTLPDWDWGGDDQGKGQGQGQVKDGATTDEHGDWGKGDSTELEREILERALKRAAEQTKAGSIPSHVLESIKELDTNKPRKWHKELRQFYRSTVEGIDTTSTWARPNRRYGLWEAGTKSGMGKKLIIGVDTSGSMSVEDIQKILTECHAMLKCGVQATVMFFDTKVHFKTKLSKHTEVKECGRGGTDFQEFLELATKQRPDAIICCTDGDDGTVLDKKIVKGIPTLWMLIAGDRKHGTVCNFGKKIVMDR